MLRFLPLRGLKILAGNYNLTSKLIRLLGFFSVR